MVTTMYSSTSTYIGIGAPVPVSSDAIGAVVAAAHGRPITGRRPDRI